MPIVNPSETIKILRKHNIHLTKKLGQHFLIDANILAKQIDAANLAKTDVVLEIGPGIGTLTEALAGQAKRVVAVEYDRRFVDVLKETMVGLDNVTVVEADAMSVDLECLGANTLVSNLPYSIGTAVLTKVLTEAPAISRLVVMLQKEVVSRLTAAPGVKDYGVLAITTGCYATPKLITEVKRNSFLPPPEVDSAIVAVNRQPEPLFGAETPDFLEFVKGLFVSRRKTIKTALTLGRKGLSSQTAESVVTQAGLSPSVRAETLSAHELFRLFIANNAVKS